jgi:hypothetical protein
MLLLGKRVDLWSEFEAFPFDFLGKKERGSDGHGRAVIGEVDSLFVAGSARRKKSESVKTNVTKTPIRKASLVKTKWTAAATTKAKRKNLNINGVARRTDMENELKPLLSMAISNHVSHGRV